MSRRSATLRPITADNLTDNAEAFARHLEAEGKSDDTIKAYKKASDQLDVFLRAQGMPLAVANITREHIEEFLISLRRRGLADATRNQRYRSLKQLWKFLEAEGEVKVNPLRNIKPPAISDNPPATVQPAEVQALVRTCDGTTFADRRDTAVISMFYDTGIRRAEMAGIMLADIDKAARTVRVIGKGDRERVTRYSADMGRTLDRYLRRRAEEHYQDAPHLWIGERGPLGVFGIEQIIQRRAHQAGLPHIHCHSFRHGYAHAYLASGGNEGDLMQLAGWRSRQMVDRYARSVAGDRARQNYDAHSPLSKLRRS
jgi:site-specific recombinase XerD